MRLTCPNCSARYDVDEAMVPPGGRDVQCSNCSTTWFQPGPRIAEPVAPPAPPPPAPSAPPPQTGPRRVTATAEPQRPRLSEVDVEGPSGAAADATPRPDRPARRQIDPDVADILREEAKRESRLRRANAVPQPPEQQEEMPLETGQRPDASAQAAPPPSEGRHDDSLHGGGLNDDRLNDGGLNDGGLYEDGPNLGGPDAGAQARLRRMADLEDAQDAFDVAGAGGAVAAAPRRDIFPDIEEINSTLRATGDRREEEASSSDVDTVGSSGRRRRGVRFGFFGVLFLAALAVGVYAYTPAIAKAVPALEGPLERYVDLCNQARFWLDDLARSVATSTTSDS